jgi:hypothetical protein
MDLNFQHNPSPFPPICGHCKPISHFPFSSNSLQPLPSVISLFLPLWQSLLVMVFNDV